MISVDDIDRMVNQYIDAKQPQGMSAPPISATPPASSVEDIDDAVNQYIDRQLTPKEHTIGERIGNVGHGLAQAAGQVADISGRYILPSVIRAQEAARYVLPGQNEKTIENDAARAQMIEEMKKSNLSAELPRRVEEMAGRKLEPEEDDTVGKFWQGTGQFLLPMPGGPVTKGLGLVGKAAAHLVPAMTASAAVHATPRFSEEGTTAGTVEDIAKAIIGGIAGAKGVQKFTGPKADIAKDISKLASQGRFKPIERMKEKVSSGMSKTGAKILAAGAKEPEARGFELAAKHKVDLPYNIGMDSRVQNFMANNVLNKTIFTTQAYKTAIKKANEDMINAVRKSISNLGDSQAKPEAISREYASFLKKEQEAFRGQTKVLYDDARSVLTESDKIIPKHTAQGINDEFVRSLLRVPGKSEATQKVVSVIDKIAKGWELLPKNLNIENLTPSGLKRMEDSLNKFRKPIDLRDLTLQRAELLRMVNYDKSVGGMKQNLWRLIGDIDKDIESSTNRAFISKWRGANDFLKTNMENRFKEDITRSILSGKAPVDAFDKMDSVQNIKSLKKALGDSPEAEKIFKDLSSAKLRQILEPVLEESLKEGTALRTGAMVRLFSKGEGKQEILETLVGKDSYNKLEEIAEISSMFSKAGKDVLNTSGTAIAAKDMDATTAAIAGVLHGIFGLGLSSAATTAGTYIGSAKLLSYLASNKRFINEARNYAVARSKGQEKQARSILNRLIDIAKREQQSLKFAAVEAIPKPGEIEENE